METYQTRPAPIKSNSHKADLLNPVSKRCLRTLWKGKHQKCRGTEKKQMSLFKLGTIKSFGSNGGCVAVV